MTNSLDFGVVFGYWPIWKHWPVDSQAMHGYSRSELYVEPVYATIKEESLESGFVNATEWISYLNLVEMNIVLLM